MKYQFPTMLRKMWSGQEVQEWLDKNVNNHHREEQEPVAEVEHCGPVSAQVYLLGKRLTAGQKLYAHASQPVTDWLSMDSAPKDGTMLRLLVEFEEHQTEDATTAPTIGFNNHANDGEDEWQFAGWCWTHDHFIQGKGTVKGWLPFL